MQARWGHINQDYSLLTKIQSILLDGHFVLEHGGRNRGGRFFNFNGTAGIWRRTAIDDAGGWQHDTLTEDLDLSYRAQLRGWRFVFVSDVIAPAEVPVEMNAFKSQQHRWAKGSIQTCRKLLPRILRADLPLGVKAEAFFHLTANFNYPLMCVLSVLMFPSMVIRYNMGWYEMLLIDVPLFFAATFSVCNFYMVCQREIHRDWLARHQVPAVPDVDRHRPVDQQHARGVRGAVQQADASSRARRSTASRATPTSGSARSTGSRWRCSRSSSWRSGSTSRATVFYALANQIYGTVPFLVLFQIGFLYTGLLSIVQQYAGDPTSSPPDWSPAARVHESQGRRPPGHARHHPSGHRSPGRARRRVARRSRRGKTTILKDNISWHFPFPGGQHDAVAARRHDPGARAARASPIRSASRTRPSSPTRSRART